MGCKSKKGVFNFLFGFICFFLIEIVVKVQWTIPEIFCYSSTLIDPQMFFQSKLNWLPLGFAVVTSTKELDKQTISRFKHSERMLPASFN